MNRKIEEIAKYVEKHTGRKAAYAPGQYKSIAAGKMSCDWGGQPFQEGDVLVAVSQPSPAKAGDPLVALFDFEEFVIVGEAKYTYSQAIELALLEKHFPHVPAGAVLEPQEAFEIIDSCIQRTPHTWLTGEAARLVIWNHIEYRK